MSSYNVGYGITPLTSSVINNFFDDVVGVIATVGGSPSGIGLIAVATSGSNIGGNGQPATPLYLSDGITVLDVHTTTLSASNSISASCLYIDKKINAQSITASLNGNGSQITSITASNISNWSSDVRRQLSGSEYVTYNTSSGVISLPFTGSTIGTTPIILGQTTNSLVGLNNISSSIILVGNLTASNAAVINTLSASSALIGNLTSSVVTFGGINIQNSILVQAPSAIQIVNSGSTIQLASGIMKISSGIGGLTTLSAVPTITTSSVQEGTRITIINVGTGTIRFQTDTSFSGPNPATKMRLISTNQDIGLLQTIELVYISGSTGFFWAQIAKA